MASPKQKAKIANDAQLEKLKPKGCFADRMETQRALRKKNTVFDEKKEDAVLAPVGLVPPRHG